MGTAHRGNTDNTDKQTQAPADQPAIPLVRGRGWGLPMYLYRVHDLQQASARSRSKHCYHWRANRGQEQWWGGLRGHPIFFFFFFCPFFLLLVLLVSRPSTVCRGIELRFPLFFHVGGSAWAVNQQKEMRCRLTWKRFEKDNSQQPQLGWSVVVGFRVSAAEGTKLSPPLGAPTQSCLLALAHRLEGPWSVTKR